MIPQALYLTAAQAASHYEVCHGGVTVSCAPDRAPVVLNGVERKVSADVTQTVISDGTVEPGLDGGYWIVPAKAAEAFAQAAKAELARRAPPAEVLPEIAIPKSRKKGG